MTRMEAPALEKYLPLGCIRLGVTPKADSPPTVQDSEVSTWAEVDLRDEIFSVDHDIKSVIIASAALTRAYWIRAFRQTAGTYPDIWRIYVLPNDVWYEGVDRRNRNLQKCMWSILARVNVSPEAWIGQDAVDFEANFDPWATKDHSSLFYIFNTLPSPAPNPDSIENPYLRYAVQRLLDKDDAPWGLKTHLHPYQRRAAAMMLQKEVTPSMQLDPRLERRTNPLRETFYYGPRDCVFWRSPRYYDTVQGGILAETMGLGKTLICIASVLATRGQFPAVPVQYAAQSPNHDSVPSLASLAAATVTKTSLPWKTIFEDLRDSTGDDHLHCRQLMQDQRPIYEIPPRIIRSMRHTSIYGEADKVQLSSGTIIVVPPNLLQQWESELSKHVRQGALKILVLKDSKTMIPLPEELLEYDILLFSRRRFENENRSTDELYTSPLKALHWLRIIIDEGHGFSTSTTNAAVVAEKLVRAERRWIVSGTPAKDLLGVEVDLPALTVSDVNDASQKYRAETLEQRRYFDEAHERTSGAAKSLGALASRYLKAQPWASSGEPGHDVVNWDDYIYRHEDPTLRTYSYFSACLRTTLGDLVVKTRPEDVERDLQLPPLHHTVVRLKPSTMDKATANLFVLLYTTNAVTSERRDRDYLFHNSSRAHLMRLTANLRQSAFYWVGFTEENVLASIETAEKYLNKHVSDCSDEDRHHLLNTVNMARAILESPIWRGASRSQDMAIFFNKWLGESNDSWLFDDCIVPPTMGLTQAVQAQKFINNQLSSSDPVQGLADAGVAAKAAIQEEAESQASPGSVRKPEQMARNGIPSSSLTDAMGDKRLTVSGASKVTPKKPRAKASQDQDATTADGISPSTKSKGKKRKLSQCSSDIDLTSDSPLGSLQLIGSASAKFSYLIDRVTSLYQSEKILIFYEGGHIAYYLSQALDLLHIKHLIYANTLSSDNRSRYVVLFDTDDSHRVLLMDIKQAAHGLNLSSASRVFFVNPPYRPDVEAQAIKRAHRIGQTRPVQVETLVLEGTVEDAIHDRATKMTRREHLAAKALEEDEGIRGIIQSATILPMQKEELEPEGQMARFESPLQLFGRPGRGGRKAAAGLEKEIFDSENKKKNKPRKELVVKLKIPVIARATNAPQASASADLAQTSEGLADTSLFGG